MLYSYIPDADLQYSSIPPRKANGGRDTGAQASGPWGNFEVMPEPNALLANLKSANPPPNAEKQPTTYNRLGNNATTFPHHIPFRDDTNMYCIKTQ